MNADRRNRNADPALKKRCAELEARVAQLEAENKRFRAAFATSPPLGQQHGANPPTTMPPTTSPLKLVNSPVKHGGALVRSPQSDPLSLDLGGTGFASQHTRGQQQRFESSALLCVEESSRLESTLGDEFTSFFNSVGDNTISMSHVGRGSTTANVEAMHKNELLQPTDTAQQRQQTKMRLGLIVALTMVGGFGTTLEGTIAMVNPIFATQWALLTGASVLFGSGVLLMCVGLAIIWHWERLMKIHTAVHVVTDLLSILLTARYTFHIVIKLHTSDPNNGGATPCPWQIPQTSPRCHDLCWIPWQISRWGSS